MQTLLTFLCALLLPVPALAQGGGPQVNITVTGQWHETIDETDLIAGAGTELRAPTESAGSAATLEVTPQAPGRYWCIDVRAEGISSWPAGVGLSVRWTDSPDSSEADGSVGVAQNEYLELAESAVTLIKGRRGFTADLQYELTGMSLAVSPADSPYLTADIVYTVYNC